jgi:uncharacterized protein YdeI (YjbR/CyaY-like superfamily)
MRDYRHVEVESRAQLRAWLAANHGQAEPIWLVTYKKASGGRHVRYDAIVEEALCFGWIDSLPRKLDGERTMLLLGPRKRGSAWSKPNRERVARLIASGAMTPAGLAKVEAAKADGSWNRLKAAEAGVVPDDLAAALDEAGVRLGWDAFTEAVRRRVLENLGSAKTDATRAKRVAQVVAGARAGLIRSSGGRSNEGETPLATPFALSAWKCVFQALRSRHVLRQVQHERGRSGASGRAVDAVGDRLHVAADAADGVAGGQRQRVNDEDRGDGFTDHGLMLLPYLHQHMSSRSAPAA